jgi:hypothetical protein
MKTETTSQIKDLVTTSVENYLKKFTYETRHVILDEIFPIERRIRSIIGGLETSMGKTTWERIIKLVAQSEGGFSLRNENLKCPYPMPEILRNTISELENKRVRQPTWISLDECSERLRQVAKKLDRSSYKLIDPPSGHGVDIYLEKNGSELVLDSKTVQINVGGGKSFNSQLLRWYAYRYAENPDATISAKIVFPYNPHSPKDWWQKEGNKVFPLIKGEALVQDYFWAFISGQPDCWCNLVNIFKGLHKEGFGSKFNKLFYGKKK